MELPYSTLAMNTHLQSASCYTQHTPQMWVRTPGTDSTHAYKGTSMQTAAFVTNASGKEFTQEEMNSSFKVRN